MTSVNDQTRSVGGEIVRGLTRLRDALENNERVYRRLTTRIRKTPKKRGKSR